MINMTLSSEKIHKNSINVQTINPWGGRLDGSIHIGGNCRIGDGSP